MDKLIDTWLKAQKHDVDSAEYDELSWAVDELYDLAHDDHDRLLRLVVDILNIDSSDKVVGALGAGVLEELFVYHADTCIDKVLELSKNNNAFKRSLNFVFLDENDVSKNILNRIKGKNGVGDY